MKDTGKNAYFGHNQRRLYPCSGMKMRFVSLRGDYNIMTPCDPYTKQAETYCATVIWG